MSMTQQNAVITISSGSSNSTINVSQTGAAQYLNTDISSLIFAASGGNNVFSILSNGQWIVVEIPTWITVSTTNGFGNAMMIVSVSQNTSNTARTYQLTLSGLNVNKVVTISQDAAPVVGSVSESIVNFVSTGGSKSIAISAGSGWTVTSNNTSVTVSPTTGNNNGTFSITGLPNRQNTPILATVSVNFGSSVSYIYVTIGSTTAVENDNLSNKMDLILSPNPAKSNSFIKFNKQISFRLLDILGNLHGKATNVTEFQITNLPSGVYFIQTNEKEVRKLVVE
ncbi:MAG: T9SS C-terminal target domain-containing protein [Bacteroidetes bacterium]|nr:MAG: T9SS C-terminal target domain-containing protein [Bacteroidota bacterium]